MGETRPRQRKFAPRSRQGCLTCRARRKRCDGQRPECQNCTRLNMKCEWQAQRRIVPESSTSPPPSESSATDDAADAMIGPLRPSINPWDALPGNDSAQKKHILNYYIEAFVPSVSVATTPSSFYTSLYVPMAFQSEGMLDAIIAISSAQLARRTVDAEKAHQLRRLSSKHQGKCHAFIRDRLSPSGEPLQDSYQVTGMTLLLVGLEALNGARGTTWLSQLACVRKILGSLCQEQNVVDCWEVDSLRRHFTYHNAMASVMCKVSRDGPQASLERELSPLCGSGMPLTIDPLMGISYYLCALISRIQYVTAPNPAFPHISEAAFHAIERDIQQWTYESPISSPNIDLPIALDLIALAESYRLAALIQLYRSSDTHKHLVPACASRAMQFISRIPAGSPAESSLLYPIFLAGAELDSEADIAKCIRRLNEIQQKNRYENVGMVQQVLQEVWRPVLNGEPKRVWEDVLSEWGWSFTLG
ncbi:putative Zn(II)2Cys6 transcription factor-like protein [Corynespora cassiicola Philippines]|uniref:Putative Zn(II)2Cys6 transcription factor-like protein n=1 Tax=Corynespora cassiicola Philippines TaxID=1448308 RepID=A0A2T2PAM5_CORCC|nr:putative Zn(II)2Cys6 transcription factor-like protein [Corynespora cassiicola Philippines]